MEKQNQTGRAAKVAALLRDHGVSVHPRFLGEQPASVAVDAVKDAGPEYAGLHREAASLRDQLLSVEDPRQVEKLYRAIREFQSRLGDAARKAPDSRELADAASHMLLVSIALLACAASGAKALRPHEESTEFELSTEVGEE